MKILVRDHSTSRISFFSFAVSRKFALDATPQSLCIPQALFWSVYL